MSYVDRFVLQKGMDNEFTLTIKQTGTTLPMEIVDNITTRELDITPAVTYVPYTAEVAYVPYQAEVAAVVGQDFIASVEGKPENYVVIVGALVEGSTYDFVINTTTYQLVYTAVAYPDEYDFLFALRDLINVGATNGITTAVVDSNKLYLTGVTDGVSYIVNGSNLYSITQVQSAVTAVAGQDYIATVAFSAEVLEVPYEAAINAHYEADNTAVNVDITTLLSDLSGITKIEIQPEVTISELVADAGVISLVNSWYDIGTDTTFTVTPATNNELLAEVLPDMTLRIRVTLTNTIDTFVPTLVKLVDNTDSGITPTLTVEDAASGKIKLVFAEADIDTLVDERGEKVDKYYLKPTYKLIIDCTTVNNGSFLAKVPEVYVEG